MNVRPLTIALLGVGLLLAGHGLLGLVANRPERFDRRKSESNAFGDVGNWFGVQSRNAEREGRRHDARTEALIGGLVALAGAILVVTERSGRRLGAAAGGPAPAPPSGAAPARFCSRCGTSLPPGASFCPSCGATV